MPGFITHYLFGVKTYHLLENGRMKSIIKNHLPAYLTGLQGPDLCFFYLPTLTDPQYPNLGSMLHSYNIKEVFSNYLNLLEDVSTKDRNNSNSIPIILSYFSGFMCHYILDYNCHPYIYGHTHYEPNQIEQLHYYASHRAMETEIDSLMFKKIKGAKPCSFSRCRHLQNTALSSHTLPKLISKCLNQSYPNCHITEKDIKRIYLSAKIECHFLDDKWGFKKPLIKQIEQKTVGFNLLSSLMTDTAICNNEDILNENHALWYSPWESQKIDNSSFLELFEKALSISQQAITLLQKYNTILSELRKQMNGKHKNQLSSLEAAKETAKKTLLDYLGNYSYHTGLDWRS